MKAHHIERWIGVVAAASVSLFALAATVHAEESGGEEQAEKQEEKFDARAALNRANSLAGRGALTRSVPHYEKVVRKAPAEEPSAHFNLAEVLKAKEEYDRALLHYQAYLHLGDKEGTKSKAKRGIRQLKARVWNKKLAELSVDIDPEKQATIQIDGFPVAQDQDLEGFELVAGSYEVSVDIVDHEPISKTVELGHEDQKSIELKPMKKTFFGKVRISVDENGAKVKLTPKKLDAPREPNEGAEKTSPVEEPIEVETGKWLVEVTKKGFHKWVRYVDVRRGKVKPVNVDLEKKLPEEIR